MVALVGSAIVDLHSRPPWSNNAVRRLGVALRDGVDPPVDCPSYAEVMLWHADLAAEVQDRIEGRSWSASELLVTSRAKSQDTLLAKLRRRPYLQLNTIQDIAGVRIDADLLLGEQTRLAREIADHFGADQPAIHDLRDHPHAGYRAVHVWLRLPAGRVEIQIRTILQIAPGVDVAIVKELGLSPSISRVVVNFMGCAAAMNALGTATNYVRAHPAMKALVVCIELCSVNAVFADDINDVVIHSLFGDGCAALVIGASQVQEKLEPGKVVVRSSFSQLLDNTEDGIVLGVNHNGITCELSENLPGYIFSGVAPVVTEMLWDNGLQISDIDLWAIHPGGPKIIEQSVRSLGISAELAAQSWDVLARFGNMLSVSLIFVLETMVQQAESAKAISTGVAFAFGPGVTVEGMLFDIIRR